MADGSRPGGTETSDNSDETAAQYTSTVRKPPREHVELLAKERRRLALDVLSGRTTPVELGELALEVATQEAEPTSPLPEASTEVKNHLHHIHLPKLEEAGLVDYDPELRTVEPTEGVAGADDTAGTRSTSAHGSSDPTDELSIHVGRYFDASTSETASLDELSRYAATRLADSKDLPAERVQMRLHHAVLPKLGDVGVIDYDPRTTMVRCRENSP